MYISSTHPSLASDIIDTVDRIYILSLWQFSYRNDQNLSNEDIMII